MMEIKVPLYAATMALYQALSDAHACGLNWYEGGTDIEEVETDFRNQATFCYGILGAADADQNDKASDIWDYNIQLEVYSNYPGRKVVAQKLQELMAALCTSELWEAVDAALAPEGFTTIKMDVGPHRLNLPIRGDNGTWQSGSVNLTIKLNQI